MGQYVPVSLLHRRMLLDYGLVSYAAAEAHRWALIATIDASDLSGSLCVQTRLVQVEFRYKLLSTRSIATSPTTTAILNETTLRSVRIWFVARSLNPHSSAVSVFQRLAGRAIADL